MKIKKILGISLLVCAAFGFAACSKPDDSVDTGNKTENTGSTENKDTTADSEPAGTENTGDQNQGETEKVYVLAELSAEEKAAYGTDITIELINITEAPGVCYTKENGIITFKNATPVDEANDIEVTLSGYFKGQIKNEVKDLVINLKDVYLENENDAVIQCDAKTEISAKSNTDSETGTETATVNYIISKGSFLEKIGAINTNKKNLDIGGSGKCYIIGPRHGIKADKITFKGSGKYFIQGGKEDSAINGNEFYINADKTVSISMYNAGNGIKADKVIDIKSGTLSFHGTETALKTDLDTYTVKKETKTPEISLKNCTISGESVSYLYYTVENNFTKDSTVTLTGIEETRAPDPTEED